MDQELLKLFTKVKILSKKVMHSELDIVRLSSDRDYAASALKQLTNAEDPELVATAIAVMARLGLLAGESDTSAPAGAAEDKYVGRLR